MSEMIANQRPHHPAMLRNVAVSFLLLTAAAGCQKPAASDAGKALAHASATSAFLPAIASEASAGTAQASSRLAYNGPLGLAMGITEAELTGQLAYSASDKVRHLYTGKPPQPMADFSDYFALATPLSGLCRIGGYARFDTVNGSGDQIRGAVDRIAASLEEKYGKPSKKKDVISVDVYRKKPQYWMVGLKEGSVSYGYRWAAGRTVKDLPDDIMNIIVYAQAETIHQGGVGVIYEFSNYADCQKELKKENPKKR
ncbi:hypothetical protein H8L32_25500 [Undibacterium sp. CY18W]|uniref:Lipoprotein n=1 Tax=Undibacterium hunanense TaxID=2762292 RepID=A0ABR6ZYE3_9BURK|nr:hypothetical protein [Undibacterium hunanense]MBC3920846.1 hypothetical protein [Undibacterium hunanense]